MALRTSEALVKGILETDADIRLAPFIRMANALTDWLASQDTDSELTASLLLEIEGLLAAHFYAHRDQLYNSKSTGGASGSFQGQTGMFLQATLYGQTAMVMDVTGKLTKRNLEAAEGKKVASADWLGTYWEEVTYAQAGDT